MRFAILTQYYPPETGAPQNRLSFLAERLVERGHLVEVLTAMPSYPQGRVYPGYGGWMKREGRDGVDLLRAWIVPARTTGLWLRLIHHLSFVFSSLIVGTFFLRRADYLLAESPPLFLGITAAWLARLKGARLIFNVSDLWPESAVRLGKVREGGLAHRLGAWLEGFCYGAAWLVSGQTAEIVESIRKRFPKVRTCHFSNGVDTRLFSPAKRSEALRKEIADSKSCIAVYAGLHGLAQGLDQILKAALGVKDLRGLQILLVGDGPEKEALIGQMKKLGLDNVRFLDPWPAGEMPSLLASADLALVPLAVPLPGAVPSKLYEAMASELPVVLVANGEAARIVRESHAGLVVRPGDITALVRALRRVAEDPASRREMGRGGREAAVRLYDRAPIASAFIQFLERELGSATAHD